MEGFLRRVQRGERMQIRGGKFKIPYGLDQTSGETNLDFIYRRSAAITSRRAAISAARCTGGFSSAG